MKPPVVLQKLTRLPRALWKWSKGRLRQGASFCWETFCPRKLQELMARRGWVAPGAVLGLEVDGKRVCAVELRRWGRRAVVLERAEAFELPEPGGGEVDVPTDVLIIPLPSVMPRSAPATWAACDRWRALREGSGVLICAPRSRNRSQYSRDWR